MTVYVLFNDPLEQQKCPYTLCFTYFEDIMAVLYRLGIFFVSVLHVRISLMHHMVSANLGQDPSFSHAQQLQLLLLSYGTAFNRFCVFMFI